MRILPVTALALTLAAGAAAVLSPAQAQTGACAALGRFADGRSDATGVLADCLDDTRSGGIVALPAGTYRIRQPLVIDRAVTLTTAGTATGSAACAASGSGCATLLIDPADLTRQNAMPVLVQASNVVLDRVVVSGGWGKGRLGQLCRTPAVRPNAGGIRVGAVSGFVVTRSVLRDFACYTPLEITTNARDLRIENNTFGPNGDHRPGDAWSDGLTVHDASRAVIRGNRFVDNTDVQLILGGCRDCVIENNRFSHTGPFRGASFAELMIHSWPTTSGNFSGTVVRGNAIDCGTTRLCGFGILVGAEPWYTGRAFGGTVSGNTVRNARIGLNVDGLTGPMTFQGNSVSTSGGTFESDCGRRSWSAVNVAPASRRFVRGLPQDSQTGAVSTKRCIMARDAL